MVGRREQLCYIKTNQLSSATCFSFQNWAFALTNGFILFAIEKTFQVTVQLIFLLMFGLNVVRNNKLRIYIKRMNLKRETCSCLQLVGFDVMDHNYSFAQFVSLRSDTRMESCCNVHIVFNYVDLNYWFDFWRMDKAPALRITCAMILCDQQFLCALRSLYKV